MPEVTLTEVALVLAGMAVAAPLARWLGIGTVLGYLAAGIMLGPYGVSSVFTAYEAQKVLHIAEFGIVLLLFLIGLELRPKRLWSMRNGIFGLGGAQVALSALALATVAIVFGTAWQTAAFIGLALALSSTAFALQVLEENGELTARHGRLAFAVLLFQDLAAIPLIALVPLFAITSAAAGGAGMDLSAAAIGLATIAGLLVVGYLTLDKVIRLIALTKVKEAMTAAALLTVVGFAVVMQWAGLSAALGAFLAGALLAESSYRHQLEADIQPFEGLLLGLFFTAVGMSLNLGLVWSEPLTVLAMAAGLIAIKVAVLFALGKSTGLNTKGARRLALSLSQGGEFAFVLLGAGALAGVLPTAQAELLIVVVTASMIATPLLLIADGWIAKLWTKTEPVYDAMPENDGHIVIAGFGRYGQITARVLRAKGIPFTALDISAEQVAFVERFGSKAFFGDASRPDILAAAQTHNARAFVLAIDDVEASMRTAEIVTQIYPHVPIIARARNRPHVYRLMDLGITSIERETFRSALATTADVLRALDIKEPNVRKAIATFQEHDMRRLESAHAHSSDPEKLQAGARSDAEMLARLFAEDEAERAREAAE